MKKGKLTILFGAGATIEVGGPTTKEVTDLLVDTIENTITQNNLIKIDIQSYIQKNPTYNFETIFYVFETLLNSNSQKSIKYAETFHTFSHKDNIDHNKMNDWRNISRTNFFGYCLLHSAINSILKLTYQLTTKFDPNSKENSFLTNFINKLNNFNFIFTTLNYDHIIEKCLEIGSYDDGYRQNRDYFQFSQASFNRQERLRLCISMDPVNFIFQTKKSPITF